MKLAGRNQVLPQLTLAESIDFFQKCGYDGIELSILRGLHNVMIDLTEDYAIQHVLECCAKKAGFEISALACHENYVIDDFIFDVQKRWLKSARKYGVDTVIMSTFIPYDQREGHEKEIYAKLVSRTRALCDIAEDEDVRIAIEIEPNQLFHNVDSFLRVADAVQSKALKVNFDIGHIYLSEVDIVKAIKRLDGFIVHGHIDNMVQGEHCHKLPWEGDIDLVQVCKALAEYGFDGFLGLDLYWQDYHAVSPECVRFIKQEVFSKL